MGIDPTDETGLSRADSKAGRLQRALLQLDVHVREGTIPTSGRFLYYEFAQLGVVEKPKRPGHSGKRSDQDMLDALTRLHEQGLVPWDWIVDETRSLSMWKTAPSVAEYVTAEVQKAALDRWGDEPAPLILCESRSLEGALHDLAATTPAPSRPATGSAEGSS